LLKDDFNDYIEEKDILDIWLLIYYDENQFR
jgi:hypothetical protein